ncbi:MAG: peptidase S8/S53 subtilisin kexin sedolisin [Ignavibacteria bacterium]|nr:MAG: peptidase S8/S53 subtilisin kexin sedolisin [Ignavibacteria bacterium]KAF0160770.1 MAG: peptidase S8/S53 subtilisin kexin sedolisin [Ignavibacteria bacterium]
MILFLIRTIFAQDIIQKGEVYYLSNTLVVKYKNGYTPLTNTQLLQKKSFSTFTVLESKQLFPEESLLRKGNSALGNIYIIKYSSNEDPLELSKKISKSKEIEYAEPKYVHRVTVVPNDSLFLNGQQINLSRIKAVEAWDITKGDSSVLIAIIDTGVEYDHPDLKANILRDKNGKVVGYDFGGLNGTPDDDPNEDKEPSGKLAYHGTHVAGIAAAVTDNKIGIASIGYNCTILPVKTSRSDKRDANGYPYVYYGFEGIKYAADKGAKIINCSWGSSSYSRYEQEIIDYATSKGSLVIGSAGNKNTNAPFFPANYKGVLSVVWGLNSDIRFSDATYGTNTDILAPGLSILSTYPTFTNLPYRQLSGSSMSAPLVAGIAGLVAAKFPNYSPLQIGEQVRVTTDEIYSNGVNPDSIKYLIGKGRANAFRAVTEINAVSVRATNIKLTELSGSNFNGLYEAGESVAVSVSLTNFLANSSGIQISAECKDAAISLTQTPATIISMQTMQTLESAFNFTFKVEQTAPYNHEVNILLKFTGVNYNDYQWISVRVNPTYDTHNANKIVMSVTSKGALGFNDYPINTEGQGFRYDNGDNLLFEGAFMYGTSETTVMDAARTVGEQSKDFKMLEPIVMKTNLVGYQRTTSKFNDSGAGNNALGIETGLVTHAFADSANSDYLILENYLTNKTEKEISNLFVGYFLDWDMKADDPVRDSTAYDLKDNFAYAFYKDRNILNTYTGFAATLGVGPVSGYYPVNNAATDGDVRLFDADEFSDREKWIMLSSGIVNKDVGYADVSYVLSCGPYKIAPKGILRIAYTIAAGNNFEDLRKAIVRSRSQYRSMIGSVNEEIQVPTEFALYQNYPNPFNPTTVISYKLQAASHVTLKVYDVLGREVATLVDEYKQAGNHSTLFLPRLAQGKAGVLSSSLASGVYFYKIFADGFTETKKMVLLK